MRKVMLLQHMTNRFVDTYFGANMTQSQPTDVLFFDDSLTTNFIPITSKAVEPVSKHVTKTYEATQSLTAFKPKGRYNLLG